MGHPIIMGRFTFEAIGKPLPGRTNIIVSRNPAYQQEGCEVAASIEAAVNLGCGLDEEVFVIGGATLYEATLPLADALYITQINRDFDGDTFFPEINRQDWIELERETVLNDPTVDYSYSFKSLKRNKR